MTFPFPVNSNSSILKLARGDSMNSSTIKNLNQGGIGIPFDFALHFVSSSLIECREQCFVKQEKKRGGT